jgi:hypothetical protein
MVMLLELRLVPVLALALASCGPDQQDKVFEQAASPDGVWLAQAVDEHHFGPGNAAHFIRVQLKSSGTRAALADGAQDVLVLEPSPLEPYPGDPAKHVSLKWQSPSRLSVTYRNAVPSFVVAHVAGVDISTERK